MQADISLPQIFFRPIILLPPHHCRAHIIVVQQSKNHSCSSDDDDPTNTEDDAVCILHCNIITVAFGSDWGVSGDCTFHTSAKGISSETDWARFLLRRATGRVLRDTDVTGRGLTLSGVVRCMIGAPGRS